MEKWKRDIIYGVVILIFCVVNFIYAGTMTQSAIKVALAKPDAYLKLWLVLFAILALIMIFRAYRYRDSKLLQPIFTRLTVFSIAAFAIYILVMPYLGFFLSTLIFLAVTVIMYSYNMGNEKKHGKKLYFQIAKYLLFALLLTIATDQLFRNVLLARLPTFTLF